jgi:site-specific recombinase XerD
MLVLLDGGARSRPRSHRTIYVYFNEVRPLIDGWSARRGHIREVTTEDIRSGLGHLSGWPLCNATMAVRSLFGFAKRQGLIFANPARGLAASRPAASLHPIDDGEIRAVEQTRDPFLARVTMAASWRNWNASWRGAVGAARPARG